MNSLQHNERQPTSVSNFWPCLRTLLEIQNYGLNRLLRMVAESSNTYAFAHILGLEYLMHSTGNCLHNRLTSFKYIYCAHKYIAYRSGGLSAIGYVYYMLCVEHSIWTTGKNEGLRLIVLRYGMRHVRKGGLIAGRTCMLICRSCSYPY